MERDNKEECKRGRKVEIRRDMLQSREQKGKEKTNKYLRDFLM